MQSINGVLYSFEHEQSTVVTSNEVNLLRYFTWVLILRSEQVTK